jgi:SMC interacting uncharacterized protein involved in chromosome segregation
MRHHTASCLCDICYRQKNPEARIENDRKQHEANEKRKKIHQIMTEVLGIPMDTQYSIHSSDLYNIFMDDEKCEALISKLKNKAFW